MRLMVMVLAGLLALPALGAVNFGDEVVDCLMAKGAKPTGPLLDADMAVCEKEVQRARDSADQKARANIPSDSAQDDVYVRCLIKRGVVPPQISREDSEFCLKEAGVPDPGDDVRKSKGKAWRDCLVPRIVQLDDSVSPVRDIAGAVAGLCAEEWRGYASSFWMNPSAKRKFTNGVEKYAVDDAVQGVLQVRSVAREKSQKSQPLPQSKYQPQ